MALRDRKIQFLLLVLLWFSLSIDSSFSQQAGNEHQPEQILPRTRKELTHLDYERLEDLKKDIQSGKHKKLYREFIRKANGLLKEGPFTITGKAQLPPSEDKHDYMSSGPYWWPDTSKPKGLPWINRDGKVNPVSRGERADYTLKNKLFKNVHILALAYYFSHKEKYALKAIELLKVWFLNPETKMNPNLNFAQGIPGKMTGRSSGIIEFSGIRFVITAIELLELQNILDQKTGKDFRKWTSEYLDWLQKSEFGLAAKNSRNNHGTWYDVQLISLLMFLKKEEQARELLEETTKNRIATQIDSEGRQQHELARTKALHYSTMNLNAFTELAHMGNKLGVDLWNYESETGSSIQKAYDFLKPYAKNEKNWNYKQITNIDSALDNLRRLFEIAAITFEQEEFCKIAAMEENNKDLIGLILSCKDVPNSAR